MKNTFVILSISFMLVINACSQGKRNNMDFLVTQCDEDTIIKLGDLCGQYAARNISLKVTGMIDDSANVSVGYDVLQPNDIIGFRLGDRKSVV